MADIRLQDVIMRLGKGEGRIIRRHRGKPAGRSVGVSHRLVGDNAEPATQCSLACWYLRNGVAGQYL